jgi:putative colanic acid biosynthesis acetyltransferase WcaF
MTGEHPLIKLGVNLGDFDNRWFHRGRGRVVEVLWLLVSGLFVRSWIPGAAHRRWLLRRFGARIGDGVQIKPGVRVKFPWRFSIGPRSWLGEDVWIDNLATVEIGADCCISQGAYLCTGSHDWTKATFDLIVKPIRIEDDAWIAARAVIAPGVTVGKGAVLGLCSMATEDLTEWMVHIGCPSRPVRARVLGDAVSQASPIE